MLWTNNEIVIKVNYNDVFASKYIHHGRLPLVAFQDACCKLFLPYLFYIPQLGGGGGGSMVGWLRGSIQVIKVSWIVPANPPPTFEKIGQRYASRLAVLIQNSHIAKMCLRKWHTSWQKWDKCQEKMKKFSNYVRNQNC